jgi:hypothetical protein
MLLNDDYEWKQCLRETTLTLSPKTLRKLFSHILFFNKPAEPLNLWNLMINGIPLVHHMSEDFKFRRTNQQHHQHHIINANENENEITEDDINNCLYCINDTIETLSNNTNNLLNLCPMIPQPTIPQIFNYNYGNDVFNINKSIYEQLPKTALEMQHFINLYNANYEKANEDQKTIFDVILDAVLHYDNDTWQKIFFIDAPGGTGKTFVCNSLIANLRSRLLITIATATSGIASLLLIQPSSTLHSTFGIPIKITECSTSSIRGTSDKSKMLVTAKVIIIDEAPTIGKQNIDVINKFLQKIMNNELPFGNKIVILAGDFRQTLAIVKQGNKADIISNLIINAPWWEKVQTLKLNINERLNQQRNNNNYLPIQQFNDFLLKVGKFDDSLKIFDDNNQELTNIIKIPNEYIFITQNENNIQNENNQNIEDNNIDELIRWCYPNIEHENSIENNVYEILIQIQLL